MSSNLRALFALALLGALTACGGEEKGVCISTLGPICNANYPKRSCDGDDQYVAAASPAEAVAYCKAQGFYNAMPKTNGGGSPMSPEEVDKTLAAGDFVSFSKH